MVLKEGTFKRKGFSSTAATNEQNIKKLPNEDAQSQAFIVGKSRAVRGLVMAIESLNLEAGSMRCKYDESYSFFNFKSSENEDNFRRQMYNKTLSSISLAPIKFKRIQTLCSHLTLGSNHRATFPT